MNHASNRSKIAHTTLDTCAHYRVKWKTYSLSVRKRRQHTTTFC